VRVGRPDRSPDRSRTELRRIAERPFIALKVRQEFAARGKAQTAKKPIANLSSVTGIATGDNLVQLSASDPGTYVTGGTVSAGYEGVDYNMAPGSTAQPVTRTVGTLGSAGSSFPINALILPAWSLTRIY
jgi:hypothetical protein